MSSNSEKIMKKAIRFPSTYISWPSGGVSFVPFVVAIASLVLSSPFSCAALFAALLAFFAWRLSSFEGLGTVPLVCGSSWSSRCSIFRLFDLSDFCSGVEGFSPADTPKDFSMFGQLNGTQTGPGVLIPISILPLAGNCLSVRRINNSQKGKSRSRKFSWRICGNAEYFRKRKIRRIVGPLPRVLTRHCWQRLCSGFQHPLASIVSLPD